MLSPGDMSNQRLPYSLHSRLKMRHWKRDGTESG